MTLAPPYTSERYIALMKAAAEMGYQILIVDSLSHQWNGEDGILQRKEQADARGGNHFTNWAPFTKEHNEFVSTLLNLPIHVIGTLRTKVIYEVTETGGRNNKGTVKKIGTAPITREGLDYEFSLVLELQLDNRALPGKDRTGLFPPGKSTPLDLRNAGAVADRLVDWLAKGGKEIDPPAAGTGAAFPRVPSSPATEAEIAALRTVLAKPCFTDPERTAVEEAIAAGLTARKAASWLARLEKTADEREVDAVAGKAFAGGGAASSASTAPATNGTPATVTTEGQVPARGPFDQMPAALATEEADLFKPPADPNDPDGVPMVRADIIALIGDTEVPQRARQIWGELYHGKGDLPLDTLKEIRGKLLDAKNRSAK